MKRYGKVEFAADYFGKDKSLEIISKETGIPITTLYVWATKQWGLMLRDYRQAIRISLANGRGPYRNPPNDVDWKEFERLYYDEWRTLDEAAPELGYKHGQALGKRARKEGYKIRKTGPRKKH